jgi:SAM-dependent methyltransferase
MNVADQAPRREDFGQRFVTIQMKAFEYLYLSCEPGLPALYRRTRKMLQHLAKAQQTQVRILDIGGRKSHYTIGLPARVTITDLPRSNSLQHTLNLGINDAIISQVQKRRSNVEQVVIDDMTRSALASASFHCAVAIEVLEHVEDDVAFIREVRRVLDANGVFLMTTPNGDFVQNTNPDHKRHYRRSELETLLRSAFESVDVQYAIPDTKYYWMSLKSWSLREPLNTAAAVMGGMINSFEDRRPRPPGANGAGMRELIAVARKLK